jgi:hypothetical protein
MDHGHGSFSVLNDLLGNEGATPQKGSGQKKKKKKSKKDKGT